MPTITYSIETWDGKVFKTENFMYKHNAYEKYCKYRELHRNIIVTFRKIEDFGYAVISSIIASWEVYEE